MTAMVEFRASDGRYAVPIAQALEVRDASGVRPLPSAAAGVVGVLDRDGTAVTVVDAFGAGGRRVLVVESAGETVALLVEEVAGVVQIDDGLVSPAPAGQADAVVQGTVGEGEHLVFLVDVAELVRSVRRRGEART